MEQFLIGLCGLPASGKTSLAQAIEGLLASQSARVVSTDRWRDEEYYENFRPSRERLVRRRALKETELLLSRGISVIHDDTNYYTSMRHELLDMAVKHETSFGIIHVKTPVDTAVKWNAERNTFIPERVIRRIALRMDIPGERYSWDRPVLSVDLSATDVASAAQQAVEALEALVPAEQEAYEQEADRQNNLIDSLTRDTVTQFLETHKDLRGDARVSTIRRSVARGAMDSEIPVEDVQRVLLGRLRRLL